MNNTTISFLSIALALGLLTPLGGCFQAAPVRQYILITEPAPQALHQQDEPVTLLVGPVKLASHLDQPRIVRRHGATRIDSLPGHQWAGNLTEMINNKLVAELGALLKPYPVFTYPGPTSSLHGKKVAIDILRFEGTESRSATIEARWILSDIGSRSIIKTHSSVFHVPLADDSYEALTTALSQGLSLLGQEMAASILSERSE